MDAKVKMIPMVDACDMPMEVLDYCDTKEIPTHYQSAVAFIPDDGNVHRSLPPPFLPGISAF